MDKRAASTLIRRLRDAEVRLRVFLALRRGLVASFYAFCVVMFLMLMGLRVAGGEHTLISYIIYWLTGLFAEEGITVEALRAFHVPSLAIMPAAGLGAAFVAGALSRMLRPIPLNQVALYLDAKTGSREQFATAYELAGASEASPLDAFLVEKAARRMERERLHRKPLFLPPRETWMQLIPIAVLALLMIFGPYRARSPRKPEPPPPTTREEKSALEGVCRSIDKLMEKEKDPARKEELKKIKKEFEKLKEENLTREKKVAKYNELMERLRKVQREAFESAREKAADQLEQDGKTRRLGEALRKGNDAMAEDALEKIRNEIDAGDLSQAEQEQLMENLRRARDAAEESREVQEKLSRYLKRLSRMEKRDSLEELARHRDLERMAEALKQRNREMYKREIKKFMEKMEKGEMSRQDIDDMREALRNAAEKTGDKDVGRGLEQLEKSLDETATGKQKAQELETMLRQMGYGHKDEEMKRMAREFSEKLKDGKLTREDMKRAARALEKAAERHGDNRLAKQARNAREKLEGPDTEQMEKDLNELLELFEKSEKDAAGELGQCEGGRWSEEDWQNALEGAEGLRRRALGKDWENSSEGQGFEWGEGGPGGPDSDRGRNPRSIRPGSGDPEVQGRKVDLMVKPELGVGQSAGRVYLGGKLYPRGKAKRPYVKVLGEMRESVLNKVESENIPANYKKRVRDFFDTRE